MPYTLICFDKPGALEIRKANREAHLAYIAETGAVEQAGPFLDPEGQMIGSLVILNVETEDQAADWAANDPYAKADLFDSVQVMHWKRVVG
ncbi:YciI family protein [Mangrovicoccus sp. HB161399]|uniref:YciI family protein n=1 Tax=Mangrovicoccus sp. HB161399 TaxID=2720392 RepID=UPI0015549491|nr:YciI family protein [Mangrovicoccus sp. HB161399]